MRRWLTWIAALTAVLCTSAAVPTIARAETGVDEVVASLGLAVEPADYVVLVDTSGSMNTDNRYTRVRSELAKLMAGLNPEDRVSLLTFDTTVSFRFRDVVGEDPDAVVAKLPKAADGEHTDIGAAIEAGLKELEKPDTLRMAALILITDGNLDAPGSPYKSRSSSAWKALEKRAEALSDDHQVAAYAVALQETTDAGLLKKVFPQAGEVGAGEVGERFAEVGGDLVRLQAGQELKEELSTPIGVSWDGDLGKSLAEAVPVAAQLTITSPYAHVPVTLSDLRVEASEGLAVAVTGLPDSVVLDPGQRVTLPVQVAVTGSAGGESTAVLAARVTTPWKNVLTDELGIDFDPELVGAAKVPAAPIELPPGLLPIVGGITAAGVGLALLFWLIRLAMIPPMNGLLAVRAGDRHLVDLPVAGRRMKIEAPDAVPELHGLSGRVQGQRAPHGETAVFMDLRFGAARARGSVLDGRGLDLGEMTVTFTSKRRRILDKIGLPADATP